MKRTLSITTIIALMIICSVLSCTHNPEIPSNSSGYPPEIAQIIVTKCAISGCHNAASYTGADGLELDTWAHMFNGSNNGAVVVAYSAQFSSLLYFVNTDSSLGPIAAPTMPYNSGATATLPPLSKAEYMTLYNWIQNGAPDKDGNIPFASNPDTRQKIYLTQQGCDLLAVIDAQSRMVMRYIPIGMSADIESPHCVRISDDGMHAYVSFLNGNYIQKIDTRTDAIVSNVNVGAVLPGGSGGSWNIVHVSPGMGTDTALLTSDWQGAGMVVGVNATNMTVNPNLSYGTGGTGLFVFPHGIATNPTFDTFFVTGQYGNVVYKFSADGSLFKKVSVDGQPAVASALDSTLASPNPHEILMTPDYSKYFLTCQSTNKVQVLDAHTDAILASIPVGTFPQEIAVSKNYPYMFVTCMEDQQPTGSLKGSVYVINYNTYQVVQIIYGDFYQPHGITIDDQNGRMYIASTNANPNGPAPHHATACTGRDGWYTVYNMNAFPFKPLDNIRYEVTVMPYSAATRFK